MNALERAELENPDDVGIFFHRKSIENIRNSDIFKSLKELSHNHIVGSLRESIPVFKAAVIAAEKYQYITVKDPYQILGLDGDFLIRFTKPGYETVWDGEFLVHAEPNQKLWDVLSSSIVNCLESRRSAMVMQRLLWGLDQRNCPFFMLYQVYN